jgi:hypothetical protein
MDSGVSSSGVIVAGFWRSPATAMAESIGAVAFAHPEILR